MRRWRAGLTGLCTPLGDGGRRKDLNDEETKMVRQSAPRRGRAPLGYRTFPPRLSTRPDGRPDAWTSTSSGAPVSSATWSEIIATAAVLHRGEVADLGCRM